LSLSHHELCFGCGSANLFGLHMELEPAGDGSVTGRFFLKQDHQGPGGVAHPGVLAAALEEAMALALHSRGVHARARGLKVELLEDAPVGVFLEVAARVNEDLTAVAHARDGERTVAEAAAVFVAVG
jgi:acyl-coenzyme A thioesterase PaaI-like protein